MHTLTRIFSSKLLLIAIAIAGLSGCQIESEPKSDLEQIRERGVLRVGTLNNQLSYYIGPDGPAGLDYELAREFAEQLGVKLEMKPAYRLSGLFPALQKGEIDLIATGLTQNNEQTRGYRAAPAYYYVSQQVVYKKGQWRPRNLEQLIEFENKRQAEFIEQQNKEQNDENSELVTIDDRLAPALVVIEESHFEPTLNQLQQSNPDFVYESVAMPTLTIY